MKFCLKIIVITAETIFEKSTRDNFIVISYIPIKTHIKAVLTRIVLSEKN